MKNKKFRRLNREATIALHKLEEHCAVRGIDERIDLSGIIDALEEWDENLLQESEQNDESEEA